MRKRNEDEGFKLHLLTTPDETGDGDLWLICPGGRSFGIAYETGPTFTISKRDAEKPWFANCQFAHSMMSAEGRGANLADLVRALRPRWENGDARR